VSFQGAYYSGAYREFLGVSMASRDSLGSFY